MDMWKVNLELYLSVILDELASLSLSLSPSLSFSLSPSLCLSLRSVLPRAARAARAERSSCHWQSEKFGSFWILSIRPCVYAQVHSKRQGRQRDIGQASSEAFGPLPQDDPRRDPI